MIKQIFVNLPVKNLDATKEFWTKLGFTFNPQFTDDTAASLVLGDNIFAMLLTTESFKRFTKKDISDAFKNTEVINAISVESREAVDTLMEKVLASGGSETRPADDYGWMYQRAFQDLDGHQWELAYLDETSIPEDPSTSVAK